ncbi:MAG TPA: SDR family NAD(P)-dependent oxidoreductase [Candidatus Paceibacterota bacterium]
MKIFITGGAGFIGSNFCDSALTKGHEVVCFDDLSTGQEFFLEEAKKNTKFQFVKGDIRNLDEIQKAVEEAKPDWVAHLAANADVRRGLEHPRKDLDVNTLGTWNVLEAAKSAGVKKILFSSTSAAYGNPDIFPTPETAPFPEQTSLYGASKAAGEGLVSAYCHGYGMAAVVFRFASIVGPRYTHGHVFDFVKKLKTDPTRLEILSDGNLPKSYVHVEDLMNGLWVTLDAVEAKTLDTLFNVFNIGHDTTLVIKDSAALIAKKMGLTPELHFTGGTGGWIGDHRVELDTSKLKALGWHTTHTIQEGIEDTVDYLMANPHLLKVRA